MTYGVGDTGAMTVVDDEPPRPEGPGATASSAPPATLATPVAPAPSGPAKSWPARRVGAHAAGRGQAHGRGSASRVGLWLKRLLVLAGLTVAVLPAGLAAHRALDDGWRPVLDNERLAVDTASFADGRPPLLGARSTSLEVETRIKPVHHLGPAETWLLGSVQVVWRGTQSMVVSVAALAAAAAAVVVLAARRIAGPWGALVAGAVTGAVAARLGTPVLADIWNPYVPIIPLAAAVASAWAAALVRWRPGLPLAVLFGTIAAQSHLTHGPLVAVAVAPVLICWRVDRSAGRRNATAAGERPMSPNGSTGAVTSQIRRDRSRLVGPILAGVIGFVLWLPPILSELTSGHSNLVNLWRAGTKDTGSSALGLGYALEVFSRVVGRPPPFGPPATSAAVWVVPQAASLGVILRVLLVLAPIVAVVALGVAWRDRAALVIGSSVLATDLAALGLLSISTYSSGAAIYQTRWLWSLAIVHWGSLAVAAVLIVGRSTAGRWRAWQAVLSVGLVGAAVVVTVAATAGALWPLQPAAAIPPDTRKRMDTAAELQSGLAREVRRHRRLVIQADTFISPATNVALDMAASLIAEGADVRISSRYAELRNTFGGHYAASRHEKGELLVVTDRLAITDMFRSGFRPVAATPQLSRIERRRLRQLAGRLRRDLAGAHLRWTKYGAVVHFGQARPRVDQLLRSNQIGTTIFSQELRGRLPDREVVDEFTDLQRRARPDTSYVVWRRTDRSG